MTSNDDYALQILQEQGLVSADQVENAGKVMARAGCTPLDTLVEAGVLTQEQTLTALAKQLGMEYVSLKHYELLPELRDAVPTDVARRYRVVPVAVGEDSITVAVGDPLDFDTLDSLRYVLKRNVEGVVTSPDELKLALDRYYATEATMEAMLEQIADDQVDLEATGVEDLDESMSATESDAPIIKLVSVIIMEAFHSRASDIHLEPLEKRFRVRYRIDGVLHEVDSPPKRLQSAIVSRVKIMSHMKISERRVPQDGRIQVNISGRELDLRVSTIPSNHGESIVMRILDKQSLALGLPNLGFFADDQQTFERLIGLSDGILLVTGPTGSGKTTTLYACLSYINHPDRKIITVEDPVEYQISGINQVQVRDEINLTFSTALRSILRQAPNVVMIGEIRDLATASIATEASLTGHLVFSTLHTNDAPSAVTRLLDIGVKPFLVASSLRAVMAQRLVRTICSECKTTCAATESDMQLMGEAAGQIQGAQIYKGEGCNACSLTGYKGRRGVFEIFLINDEIQRMIFEKVPANILRDHGRQMGMRTLREDGMRKVATGMTTVDEVMRVTMGDEN